uniref:Uncharacterized protein n=1 Tax=Oryza meridionalis TaxID=40149 RepID=A0A0E0FED4_9ORYZ
MGTKDPGCTCVTFDGGGGGGGGEDVAVDGGGGGGGEDCRLQGDCGFRTCGVILASAVAAASGSPGAGAPPAAATLLPLAAAALSSALYWDSLRCCLLPLQIVEIFLRVSGSSWEIDWLATATRSGSPVAGWSGPTVGWIDGGEEGGMGGSDQASKRSKFLSGTGCKLRSSDQVLPSFLHMELSWKL